MSASAENEERAGVRVLAAPKDHRFDWSFPYATQKMPALATCMVCTSQPLAAQAGLHALNQGGNAVDAALAVAITLTVVEPVMNGIGGDMLALVWDGKAIQGLNGSGRAPSAWNSTRFRELEQMPAVGWESVTVPGAVAAWVDLSERYGRLGFSALFDSAIRYAEEGFLVSPTIARQWEIQSARVRGQPGFDAAFLPHGVAPRAGERFSLPEQAQTLREIARTKGEAFYRGELALQMVAHCKKHNGALTMEDLDAHRSEWTNAITGRYRSLKVHQLPPNAQGLAVLIALGILEHFEIGNYEHNSADRIHLQIEAMRVAFCEVYAGVSEPLTMRVDWTSLIDAEQLSKRARAIDLNRAGPEPMPTSLAGGTVYVASADASGMIVSLIQSNYRGFGSGVVVPDSGISLHDRAAGFSLNPAHPNAVQGGKRPFHTLMPALLSRAGKIVAALGVVGANMQPQGQLQIISNLEDYAMNPQAALDAPRWRIRGDGRIMLEDVLGDGLAQQLADKGHDVMVCARGDLEFGGAQLVHAMTTGYVGASDPRRDGIPCGV